MRHFIRRIALAGALLAIPSLAAAQGYINPGELNYGLGGYGQPYGAYRPSYSSSSSSATVNAFQDNRSIHQTYVNRSDHDQVYATNRLATQVANLAMATAGYKPPAIPDHMTQVKDWHFDYKTYRLPLYDFVGTGPEINDPEVVSYLVGYTAAAREFEEAGYSDIGYVAFKDEAMKKYQQCDGVLAGTKKDGVRYMIAGVRLAAGRAGK